MTRRISVVYCFIDNHDQSMSSASSKDFWEYISRLAWLRTGSKGERGEVAYIIQTNHLSLFFLFFICCFWGFPKLRLISRLSIHRLRNCIETWRISLLFYIQRMQIISGTIVVPRKSWKKWEKQKITTRDKKGFKTNSKDKAFVCVCVGGCVCLPECVCVCACLSGWVWVRACPCACCVCVGMGEKEE